MTVVSSSATWCSAERVVTFSITTSDCAKPSSGLPRTLGGVTSRVVPSSLLSHCFGGRGLHALDVVEDCRQDLVVDVDHAHRFVGDVVRRRGDDGDRRADLEDLLGEEEAVGRAAADLHVLVDVGQIAAVQDRDDTGERLGFASCRSA